MNQAEVTIHEIEVQMKTLPPRGFDEGTLIGKRLLKLKREGTAFQDRENTDQAMPDSVALGHFSRPLLLVDVR